MNRPVWNVAFGAGLLMAMETTFKTADPGEMLKAYSSAFRIVTARKIGLADCLLLHSNSADCLLASA